MQSQNRALTAPLLTIKWSTWGEGKALGHTGDRGNQGDTLGTGKSG